MPPSGSRERESESEEEKRTDRAVSEATRVSLLVNNAGSSTQGTCVSALYVGHMDTDMTRGVEDADDVSRFVRSKLSEGMAGLYPQFS